MTQEFSIPKHHVDDRVLIRLDDGEVTCACIRERHISNLIWYYLAHNGLWFTETDVISPPWPGETRYYHPRLSDMGIGNLVMWDGIWREIMEHGTSYHNDLLVLLEPGGWHCAEDICNSG